MRDPTGLHGTFKRLAVAKLRSGSHSPRRVKEQADAVFRLAECALRSHMHDAALHLDRVGSAARDDAPHVVVLGAFERDVFPGGHGMSPAKRATTPG